MSFSLNAMCSLLVAGAARQQVGAVEARILGELVDLGQQAVVLLDRAARSLTPVTVRSELCPAVEVVPYWDRSGGAAGEAEAGLISRRRELDVSAAR